MSLAIVLGLLAFFLFCTALFDDDDDDLVEAEDFR